MTEGIPSVRAEDFSAEAAIAPTEIKVRMSGNADLVTKPLLDRFLGDLHSEAARRRVPEVIVDVRPLEFMNSSCLKSFVSWIGTLEESEEPVRYRITFLSNPAMLWQKRSLHALSCFGADLVHVSALDP